MDAQLVDPQLINETRERYQVGPRYAEAYLRYHLGEQIQEFSSLKQVLEEPAPKPIWFDYALSSNWRGEIVSSMIAKEIPPTARRYLDVGCGFGGFVVAFSKLGLESHGIEIDTSRIKLAEANCADQGVQDRVMETSILEEDLVSRLGTFDVITMIDVIEHVPDVPKTVRNVVELLNPGGLLLIEVPNKDGLVAVAHDGHFNLFGITQLPRLDAIQYHKAFFAFEYDVGDYYRLDFYLRQLAENGCQSQLLPIPDQRYQRYHRFRDTWPLFRELRTSYQRYRAETAKALPRPLDRKVRVVSEAYQRRMAAAFLVGVVSRKARMQFKTTYLTDFWTILARKEPK